MRKILIILALFVSVHAFGQPPAGVQNYATTSSPYLAKSANYTVTAADITVGFELNIYVDATAGSVTITLPAIASFAASGRSYKLVVFKTDVSANSVSISGGATNINGATTYPVTTQYNSVAITSNGTQFYAR